MALRGVNPDSTQANIEALDNRDSQEIVRQHGSRARANGSAHRTFGTRLYHALSQGVCSGRKKSQKVELLPFLLDSVAGVASLNQGDGVHPNKVGVENCCAKHVSSSLLSIAYQAVSKTGA